MYNQFLAPFFYNNTNKKFHLSLHETKYFLALDLVFCIAQNLDYLFYILHTYYQNTISTLLTPRLS